MTKRIETRYRTHTCDQLRSEDIGQDVTISGWLRGRRNLGGVLFLQIADHYGITQVVVNPTHAARDIVAKLNKETVLRVTGLVALRTPENINPRMRTGTIEVVLRDYEILGSAEPTPFPISPDTNIPEEQRLPFRFLDLRRSRMHRNIELRSRIIQSIRERMWKLGFLEFQTPTLTSSSPEGARDYLVPSRRYPGKFYALPQAPQQFKQLLMVSGFDRYFQIAPCYRDEDARADRSPGEFYQLDLEMSFVTQEDVFAVVENVMVGLFCEFCPAAVVTAPFPRITFSESMFKFGSDKPDLRNPLRIVDLSDIFLSSDLQAFSAKTVRCIAAPLGSSKPRSFFDRLEGDAKKLGARGLAWLVMKPDGPQGPLARMLEPDILNEIIARCHVDMGGAIFACGDERPLTVCKVLAQLRDQLGRQLDLIEKDSFRFCWVVDFPMFELNEETNLVEFSHNPFSMPQGGMDALCHQNPLDIKAHQYDLVCNGFELSSGAIRNHRLDVMYKAFEIVGYARNEVDEKFGALAKAFRYGAPPHGGIAPGIDRIVMLITGEPNIREVIAFPLSQTAEDLLMGAPSVVRPQQLQELGLSVVPRPK